MKIDYNFPWKTKPLSSLITESMSGVSLGDNDFSETGFPVAHKGDVRSSGVLDLSARNSRYVKKESFELNMRAQVTKDHLVVSLRDLVPTAPQLGLINQLPEGHTRVLLAQGTYGFKVDPNLLDKTFLSQLSSVDLFRATMKKNAVGSTQKHMRSTEFFELEIPLPPLKEQVKIGNILSTWDKSIEKIDHKIKLLLEKKNKIQTQLLSNEYEIKPLQEICWFQEGPGLRKWQFTSSGIKAVNITNIVNGYLELSKTNRYISLKEFEEKYRHFSVDAGDILVASSGNSYCKHGVARDCDLPLVMNTSVIRFKPINGTDYNFLNQFLKSTSFKKQIDKLITGGAQPNFGPVHLNQIQVPVPEVSMQRKIGELLELLDKEFVLVCSIKSKVILQKQGLMQQLLTGKKRVKV